MSDLRAQRRPLSGWHRNRLAGPRAAIRPSFLWRRSAVFARFAVWRLEAGHRPLQRLADRTHTGLSELRARTAGADRDDNPQSRLPGYFPRAGREPARIAAAGVHDRRRGILRQLVLPEGRAAIRRSHHDGEPELCRGDPERTAGNGFAGFARAT